MGFCRRCGDIVVGARCKCGGSSVGTTVTPSTEQRAVTDIRPAPVVKWTQGDDVSKQDRWSRTYVTRDKSPTDGNGTSGTPSAPVRTTYNGTEQGNRFPRPNNYAQASQVKLGAKVSAHIASATATRPLSPLKHSSSASEDSNVEEGILPNLHHSSELAKVYGSVLQPKESLDSYACAVCSTVFPPDATIYPDPSSLSSSGNSIERGISNRFLCRPCFISNGGSKGNCPSCHRPVLILKAEGGFVEAAGSVWHKNCFNCDGCLKNIGDHPMVDLLGRPSCADCFETCLKRPTRDTPITPLNGKAETRNNLGFKRNTESREGSPALEELEHRLGISKSRGSTPAREEYAVRRLDLSSFSPKSRDSHDSPLSHPDRSSYGRESSPTTDRFSFRSRTNSIASSTNTITSGIAASSVLSRYGISEPDSSDTDASPRSHSYATLRSPDPEVDDSPLRRRLFDGVQSPPRNRSGSPRSSYSGSPKHHSPAVKPTEAAIEEMKRRFLNQAASCPKSVSSNPSSATTTPGRRRPKSRSKSRPRHSDTSVDSARTTPRQADDMIRPALKSSASTSSLRSALRAQTTGGTGFTGLQSHRTGESTMPLLRSQKTGDTESELALQRDLTNSIPYVPRQRTGDTIFAPQPVRHHKAGDKDFVHRQQTGETIYKQDTGRTEYVRRQRTGDKEVRIQMTGDTAYSLRTHKTGEIEVQTQKTGDTDYTLRRDRTGEDEVESLLGSMSPKEVEDLIDLSVPGETRGPMSKVPLPTRSNGTSIPGLRARKSSTSPRHTYEPSVPPTPDLSDFSDTMSTRSSGPSTPPSISPPVRKSRDSFSKASLASSNDTTPTAKSKRTVGGITIPEPLPADTRCAKCTLPLFSTKFGGKFVTVPEEPTSTGIPPKTYHASCFRCNVCGEVFEEREGGHAVFVRGEEGACHVRCAPPEKITLRKIMIPPSTPGPTHTPSRSVPSVQTTSAKYVSSSSRYDRPPPTAPSIQAIFTFPPPRFGGSSKCPECNQAVGPMERGVVAGPQGTRWHATCLICGGKGAKGRRKEPGKPGCGKNLDSAAKTDAVGRVWCRECLLLLPMGQRQPSPARLATVPNTIGNHGTFVAPQNTGTTTLARQMTGIGGTDPALLRQLTGGGLSPTRQLSSSPTKMHDGPRPGAARYPRPKSVTGVRSTGGESRGMFLVRQLTGGNSSFSGNDYGL